MVQAKKKVTCFTFHTYTATPGGIPVVVTQAIVNKQGVQ